MPFAPLDSALPVPFAPLDSALPVPFAPLDSALPVPFAPPGSACRGPRAARGPHGHARRAPDRVFRALRCASSFSSSPGGLAHHLRGLGHDHGASTAPRHLGAGELTEGDLAFVDAEEAHRLRPRVGSRLSHEFLRLGFHVIHLISLTLRPQGCFG